MFYDRLNLLSQGEKIDEDASSGDAFEDALESEFLTADIVDSEEVCIICPNLFPIEFFLFLFFFEKPLVFKFDRNTNS